MLPWSGWHIPSELQRNATQLPQNQSFALSVKRICCFEMGPRCLQMNSILGGATPISGHVSVIKKWRYLDAWEAGIPPTSRARAMELPESTSQWRDHHLHVTATSTLTPFSPPTPLSWNTGVSDWPTREREQYGGEDHQSGRVAFLRGVKP